MPLRLPELIPLLFIVLLFFGAKRLPEMAASIGKSVNSFKKGMNETDETTPEDEAKALEAKRVELDAIERELASKKAQATAYEASRTEQTIHTTPKAD